MTARRKQQRLFRLFWTIAVVAIGAAALSKVAATKRVDMTFVGVPRDCAAARAAGLTAILRGSAHYSPHLDADGDGIACEFYVGNLFQK